MAKDILKEAIADAKAVREVALANAKAALEEAFTPKLQSMLSAKLTEELDEADDMDETMYDEEKDMEEVTGMEEEKDMDETMYDEDMDEEKDMEEMAYDEAKDDMDENLDEEINLEEILSELELEEAEDSDKKVDEVKHKDEKDSMEEAKEDDDKKMEEVKDKDDKDSMEEAKDDEKNEEKLDEMGRPIYKADSVQTQHTYKADYVNEDSEFDLDSLLEEINNLDEKEETDEAMNKDDMDEMGYGMEEAEDTNEVVATGLAGIAGLVAAAGGMAKLKMAAEDPAFKEKYPKIAKMLGKLEDMGSAAGQAMRREREEMAEELNETKKALETIKGELNEVNLLNSKLLYVNRIFKANQLDEAQKLRVVETLDKAESTKEAKLIYETIKDTFNVAKSKKVSKSKTRTIKEGLGMASKAAGTSTAPKKEVISESNDMVSRFQKLANIKIKE